MTWPIPLDPAATDAGAALQQLSSILQAGQAASAAPRAAAGSLPLTVITGFLGAGKTTLVNRLLDAPHGLRLAVLVNDFGRINVDATLIRERSADTLELANGCVCCSMADGLARSLLRLSGSASPPDAIVLETSGLADPLGVVQVALANPALRLDAVLAVVDAETLAALSADPDCGPTLTAQLAAADFVLLNKLDLVDAAGAARAHAVLQARFPDLRVVEATDCDVPAEIVLGPPAASRRVPLAAAPRRTEAFESWSLAAPGRLDRDRFESLIDDIAGSLLRAKGLLVLADAPDRHTLYQRVGRRWRYSPHAAAPAAPASDLVLIGRAGAHRQADLAARFAACAA